jgi:hypothetical protein
MNRSVADTARILGVDGEQMKAWAWTFKDHLSGRANPGKGRPRKFTDSDVLALIYVCQYRDLLDAHTPILQEPPDDLDETCRHGILLIDGYVEGYLALARNYRESADALLDSALKSGEPRDGGYPVLFAYRHTLELYLKIIGAIDEHTHSLKECVRLVEKRHGHRIPSPAREWIIELDEIDPAGTAFRYADEQGRTMKHAEHWLDFVQFKFAMTRVFTMLDFAVPDGTRMGRIDPTRI